MEANVNIQIEQKMVFVLLGTGMQFNEAFCLASLNDRLFDQLRNGIEHFVYKKLDGTFRIAYGTLCTRFIQREQRGKGVQLRKKSAQVYFDIEKESYRSFKYENLISIF